MSAHPSVNDVEEQSVIPEFAKLALRPPTTWLQGLYRLGLLGVSIWLVTHALVALWAFTIDDSGISYAYAKHIAQGWGPVAAPGAPWVEGYSNALWVFVLVPFQWLGLPLATVSKWLGVLGFAVTVASGVWLLVKEYGWRIGTAALAAGWMILLGTCVEVVVWIVAGLENALLGALMLGLLVGARAERERPQRFTWCSLLAFGLCITRPEGIMYAAPILALEAWDARSNPARWRSARRAALVFVVLLIAYHLVHFAVFHEWVPNTYFAKPRERSLGRGIDYLVKGARDTGLVYLLPVMVIGCFRAVRNKLGLMWYCVGGVTFILYSGGDWMPYARFVSFFAPAVVLLAVHGVANIGAVVGWASRRWAPRMSDVLVEAGVLSVVAGAVFAWQGYHRPRLAKEAKSKFCHFCQRTNDSKRLQKVSQEAGLGRVSVLTHDFGGPSWQSDEQYYPIDFLGLCDASVARIRRDQDRIWPNTMLAPYLFHEQPQAPTWLYLPKNFWRGLKDLPEYRSGYYTLSWRLLPHAPGGSYVSLHRGRLVDYFAPLDASVEPRSLSPALGLFGAGWFAVGDNPAKLEAGGRLRVVLSVVPRTTLRGSETVWVELRAEDKVAKSERVTLGRGISGLGSQLAIGEPLRLEFTVSVPKGNGSVLKLAVGVGAGKRGKERAVEVAELAMRSELRPHERVAPRFPSGLPVAERPELVALQRRVATAIDRQHHGSKWLQRAEDVELAGELRRLGDGWFASSPPQAYLAYAWATQLDARQWEELTKPMLALREPIDDARVGNELALLRDFYGSVFAQQPTAPPENTRAPEPNVAVLDAPKRADAAPGKAEVAGKTLRRLVAFYASLGESAKREYFERQTGAPVVNEGELWTYAQSFESDEVPEWTGDRNVFAIEHPDEVARKRRRGLSGGGYFTSHLQGDKAKGKASSSPFQLDGERLSFSFGGGAKSEVGVELLVDGAVVLATSGSAENVLLSFWWDVSPWSGKTAQLRVFDNSARQSAFLDQVLLWK